MTGTRARTETLLWTSPPPRRLLLAALALLAAGAEVGGSPRQAPKQPPVAIQMNTSRDLHTDAFARDRFPELLGAGFSEIYDGTIWSWLETEPGRFAYEELDFVLSRAHRQGLKVFVKIGAKPPTWWWRQHDADVPRFNDGTKVFDPVLTPERASLSVQSYASEAQRADYARFLRTFIRRMEQQPYAEAIVGYNVLENELGFSGRRLDAGGALFTDYSDPMRRYFRTYLAEAAGHDIDRLNEMLGTRFESFATIEPPQPRRDFSQPETRPIWVHFMAARKRAQLEFFNSAIRAAKSVTAKPIAGSELATASAEPYASDYGRMATDWFPKFLLRGDYPKYYLDTEADVSPVNIYVEHPALLNNILSLSQQYAPALMVGEFGTYFRKLRQPLPEEVRRVYPYGWGGVIPLEPLTVYKHLWSLFDIRRAYFHRLMYFMNPAHQPAVPEPVRRQALREIARPFPYRLTKAAPEVLVDVTFEDVNAAPAAFHANLDHYGKLLASLGVSYNYGNSRDLGAASLGRLPAVIVPADSVLDNEALEAYASRGGRVLLFPNAWSQAAASLRRADSWLAREIGTFTNHEEGQLVVSPADGVAPGDRLRVGHYVSFEARSDGRRVLAADQQGRQVIVRTGNIIVCGVDLAALAAESMTQASFSLLTRLLSEAGIVSWVREPNQYVSILPLADGYYIYSPTVLGPREYRLSIPVPASVRRYRSVTHDSSGRETVGEWTPVEDGRIEQRIQAGDNVIVEWQQTS